MEYGGGGYAVLAKEGSMAPMGMHALLAPVFAIAVLIMFKQRGGSGGSLRHLVQLITARSEGGGIPMVAPRNDDDDNSVDDLFEVAPLQRVAQPPASPSQLVPIRAVTTKGRVPKHGSTKLDVANIECHKCHKKGHFKRDCPMTTAGQSKK